jgi:hypothetical protein
VDCQQRVVGRQKPDGLRGHQRPVPSRRSDPIRYGYSNRIAPRPYEPRLAAVLSTVAWAAVHNPTGKKEDAPTELPEMPELTVAHPVDPIARLDQLLTGKVEADLRYAEIAVWEPLTDARRLLGPGGLAGGLQSPYLQTALRRLDDAGNWNEVRSRLAEVHDIAHHELPMIPLWQTVNYFAYRETLPGIGQSPVLLYQNIHDWAPSTAPNVARTDSASP